MICVGSVVGAGRGYLGCLKRFGVHGGLAWVRFFGGKRNLVRSFEKSKRKLIVCWNLNCLSESNE